MSLELSQKISEQAIYFTTPETANNISNDMISILSEKKIILLGETHYVQEHHDFLTILLPRLYESGLRLFSNEDGHAQGYIFNKYVSGEIDSLSDSQKNLNLTILKALRDFNLELKTQGKDLIEYQAFDVNHGGLNIKTLLTP